MKSYLVIFVSIFAFCVLISGTPLVYAQEKTVIYTVDSESSQNDESRGERSSDGSYERAIILKATEATAQQQQLTQTQKSYTVEILSGPERGKTRTIASDISANPYQLNPKPGDKVIVLMQPNPEGGESHIFIEGFDRRTAIYWLIALFALTIILLAGFQGVKVVFSIGLSILLIGWILIPGFLKGINPLPLAFLISFLLSSISAVFGIGWNRKALVTVIGTMGGVAVAYLISVVFTNWSHLSGLASEEDRLFFSQNPHLNPRGLLFAGIAIAAMGVVEDVAVSIASGVMEVRRANPRLRFKELFRSGMIVGRDHMSALANTLVFAYVGASLSTLLLYTQYGGSWAKFINFDTVVDEIIRSLSGTIGLVFTVPITALLAAWVAQRGREQEFLKQAQSWQDRPDLFDPIHQDSHTHR